MLLKLRTTGVRELTGRFRMADKEAMTELRAWAREAGRETVHLYRAYAPERTGRLKRGLRFATYTRGRSGISLSITSEAPYTGFVRHGTRPHMIFPRRLGGVLVFFWEKTQRLMFLRHVHHPGTRPNDFVAKAETEGRAEEKRWQLFQRHAGRVVQYLMAR